MCQKSLSNLTFLDLPANCAPSSPVEGLNRGMTKWGERNACFRPGELEANSDYLKPEKQADRSSNVAMAWSSTFNAQPQPQTTHQYYTLVLKIFRPEAEGRGRIYTPFLSGSIGPVTRYVPFDDPCPGLVLSPRSLPPRSHGMTRAFLFLSVTVQTSVEYEQRGPVFRSTNVSVRSFQPIGLKPVTT